MITNKAKKDGKILVTRGTIGSSLIAYLLGISYIDPIKYNIPFETLGGINGDKFSYAFELVFSCGYVHSIFQYAKLILEDNNINFSHEGNIRDITKLKFNFLEDKNISDLEKLEEITGINHSSIDIENNNLLKLINEDIFDTIEVERVQTKNIIRKVNPKTIDSLIKVFSLIKGTNIWEDNVEELIKEHRIEEVACSRDDVYLYLIDKGIKRETAFRIMEFVRKGRANQQIKRNEPYVSEWNNYVDIMRKNDIPEWYINSLEKIMYMFPKAHSTQYTLLDLWLSWYKINYPTEIRAVLKIGKRN